jgi:hypothetical protein
MVVKLDKVIPFGRSLDEYIKMFSLSKSDLNRKILGVGDGSASFNAEGTKMDAKITSIDPIYKFSATEIRQRFDEAVDDVISQIESKPNSWVWSYHKSPEDLKQNRIKAIEKFTQDYDLGKQEGRYKVEELPTLSFHDREFDLALCSHFLFLYSEHYNYQFHYDSIAQMLRVSREVRIFPLLTLMWQPSPYLDRIVEEFSDRGYKVSISQVEYELQPGGNKMLIMLNSDS